MKSAATAAAFGLLAAASHAQACAVRPPPPTSAEQTAWREGADQLILARIVAGRFSDGSTGLFYRRLVSLSDDNPVGGHEPLHWNSCDPRRAPGDLVLIYYRRVEVRDPTLSGSPWWDLRAFRMVDVRRNADPGIGPLLRVAASRERDRATAILASRRERQ